MLLRRLTLLTLILALTVVFLGAYTRLKDAGLGCPDWPGCYGHIGVPTSPDEINRANSAFPERPVETEKAWAEMIHRYFASSLGLFIIGITILLHRQKKTIKETPVTLGWGLLGLVLFQGLLGMWTVTLKLYPPIVMGHLLGGFTIVSLLWLLHLKLAKLPLSADTLVFQPDFQANLKLDSQASQSTSAKSPKRDKLYKIIAASAFALLVTQIALGGWTASNYAAIACIELPICQGEWLSRESVKEAFTIHSADRSDFEFGLHLSPQSKVTIHMTHRLGALITTIAIIAISVLVLYRAQRPSTRWLAISLLVLLTVQVALGLSNILLLLPLPIAVAHNVVALLLLLNLISLLITYHGDARWEDPSPSPVR